MFSNVFLDGIISLCISDKFDFFFFVSFRGLKTFLLGGTQHCQSPICSDQVLLDILYMEGVMFNIRFTYLKIVDVAQDF